MTMIQMWVGLNGVFEQRLRVDYRRKRMISKVYSFPGESRGTQRAAR